MPSTNYRQQKVGRNFKTAIANADITRTALAEQLGVHQSSFTYWYKRGVTADYANQVADLLDLDVKDIMSKHKRKPNKFFIDELRQSKVKLNYSEPRTVNIELLAMVANMRLSAQQETTLHSLALTFLGEES
jgi:uncharacterized HAD superfamily protein